MAARSKIVGCRFFVQVHPKLAFSHGTKVGSNMTQLLTNTHTGSLYSRYDKPFG
jgi:hypothetical protein